MTTRSKDTVQNDLARWERQRAAIQQRLAHIAAAERQNATPADRVELAQEKRKLAEQLEIVQAEMAPLQGELDAIDRKEAADLAAIEALKPKGEKAYQDFLAAFDALEAAMRAALALENQCSHHGVVPWTRVPGMLPLAVAQARQVQRFVASIERDRLEAIERQAKQSEQPQKPKPAASGAVGMWEELRGRLGRAAREAGDGAG